MIAVSDMAKKPDSGAKTIPQWIQDLSSNQFPIRTRANDVLKKIGPRAEPALVAALKGNTDVETRRRIEDLLYWREQRRYPWLSSGRKPIVRFVLYTLPVVPLLWQAARGWSKVRDGAWLYHVPVCWTTLWLYGWAVVRSALHRAPHSREGWQH